MPEKSGFAFHCHHDTLVEYVYDYAERREYIRDNKREGERALRLRLFKMIPEDRLPRGWGTVTEAWAAHDKARAAYNKTCAASAKAGAACDKARAAYAKALAAYNKALAAYAKALAAYNKACAASAKAGAACDKAWAAYNKARVAYDKARAVYLAKNKEKFEALHKELCPNCPWDGKTIFPTK